MFTILTSNFYLDISLAHWLVVISSAISLTGAFAYIRDMFRGKSKPNLVTWGLWAFAPLIATGAALSADADAWATVRIFMSGFGPLLVFLAAFIVKQGYWKLSKFDYACGAFSLIALATWVFADSPILAILLAAIADLFASLPTILKAWRFPETETLYTYLVGFFTASIIIPAIPAWNIENAAFQVYLLVVNTTLFFTVLRGYSIRRRKINQVLNKQTHASEITESLLKTISNLPKPILIGISGFGGSGKTSFAKKLGGIIGAPVIGVDSFQKNGAFNTQFSLWEIMDYNRLENEVLQPFLGKKEEIQYSHFDASREIISETKTIKNEGVLIIEGVGLFRSELLKYFSYKIWIDLPMEEAIARGKKRDREEYGNPTDELWDGVWKENDIQYMEKFKPRNVADLVVDSK